MILMIRPVATLARAWGVTQPTLWRAWLREAISCRSTYLPAGSGAIRVVAVSGRGLFRPPPVTTRFPEMIAAAGASSFSDIVPTTCHVSALGSYSSKSFTTLRGG